MLRSWFYEVSHLQQEQAIQQIVWGRSLLSAELGAHRTAAYSRFDVCALLHIQQCRRDADVVCVGTLRLCWESHNGTFTAFQLNFSRGRLTTL